MRKMLKYTENYYDEYDYVYVFCTQLMQLLLLPVEEKKIVNCAPTLFTIQKAPQ